MNTLANNSKPVKTSRRIVSRTLRCEPACMGWWITIRQTMSDATVDQTVYGVEEVSSNVGRSFEMTRVQGDDCLSYRVDLSGDGRQHCERTNGEACPAFRRSGNTECKHCDALCACIDAGKMGPVGYPGAEQNDDASEAY